MFCYMLWMVVPLTNKTRFIPSPGHFDYKLLFWCTVFISTFRLFSFDSPIFSQNLCDVCIVLIVSDYFSHSGPRFKENMSIIFSVMIKAWTFTCKCYGRDNAISSQGKRQRNDKCWTKVWLWYNIIWKWKVLSHIQLFGTPWTVAYQAPLPMEFSRPEYWSG